MTRLTIKLVILGLLVVACALPALREFSQEAVSGDVVTLRYWNGFAGPDGRAMLALVRKFNDENPDVEVVMQRMDWPPYYNKLFVAGLGGRAPEVFVVHTDSIKRFLQARFVRPIDDLMGQGGIDVSDIDANVYEATEGEGKHWGVPLDVHPIGLFYNKTLFRKAGLVDERGEPKPPTNRQEFIEALRALKQVDRDGDGRADTWGFVYTWLRTNLYTMIEQFGGGLYDEEADRVTFDRPENVRAFEFAASLVAEKLAPDPQNFDAWVGFLQGKVGMTFEGIYMLQDLKRQGELLDWGAAPMPSLGVRKAAWANSHNICLRADLEGKELEAAKRFVKFLSDNSLDWAQGGQVPVRKSLRATERFEWMTAQRVFAEQIPYAAYMPAVPYIFEIQGELDYVVEQALRGADSAKVLASGQKQLEEVAARYRTPELEKATVAEVGQ